MRTSNAERCTRTPSRTPVARDRRDAERGDAELRQRPGRAGGGTASGDPRPSSIGCAAAGAAHAAMSGSGSACFGLFDPAGRSVGTGSRLARRHAGVAHATPCPGRVRGTDCGRGRVPERLLTSALDSLVEFGSSFVYAIGLRTPGDVSPGGLHPLPMRPTSQAASGAGGAQTPELGNTGASLADTGASPSGKARDFESRIRRFESFRPSQPVRARRVPGGRAEAVMVRNGFDGRRWRDRI